MVSGRWEAKRIGLCVLNKLLLIFEREKMRDSVDIDLAAYDRTQERSDEEPTALIEKAAEAAVDAVKALCEGADDFWDWLQSSAHEQEFRKAFCIYAAGIGKERQEAVVAMQCALIEARKSLRKSQSIVAACRHHIPSWQSEIEEAMQ